jgi:hypothetical protein
MIYFVVALLCVLHLVVGVLIGINMIRSILRPSIEAAFDVIRCCHNLSKQAADIPINLHALFDDLVNASNKMSQKLAEAVAKIRTRHVEEVSAQVFDQKTVPSIDAPCSQEELNQITKSIENEESVSEIENVRRPYDVDQFIAIVNSEKDYAAHFQRVHCIDLSSGGMSFFCKQQMPIGQLIVASLGNPRNAFFVYARVTSVLQAINAKDKVSRIGCKFINRISDTDQKWRKKYLGDCKDVNGVALYDSDLDSHSRLLNRPSISV